MSRGGRGGGRGGKRGPDLSWQDEDLDDGPVAPQKNIPGPAFPDRHIPTPNPLSREERDSVHAQLLLRERIRSGPLYTVFEPSILLDQKGKSNPRAGFDPFNDQERFTERYHRKKRTAPDLSERGGYTLRLFPVELWPVLDPKCQQTEYWDTLSEDVKARITNKGPTSRGTKRKRTTLRFDDSILDQPAKPTDTDSNASDDDDSILPSNLRRSRTAARTRRTGPTTTGAKQKRGLDAEDDYPDNPADDDPSKEAGGGAGGDGEREEEPADSEFGTDEDDDDGGDDYNAEQYFDDGEKDDFGDADDDGDGGGGGDYY